MRNFCALVLMLAICGCGDDTGSQIGAGGNGGSGGSGGAAGMAGSGGTGGTAGTGGMAGAGGTGGSSGSGDFISLGDGTLTESETHVAADANGNIVAGWIAIYANHTSSNGYTVSHDNGATWSAVKHIDSPGSGAVASDPVLAADSQGHFYMTWVGFVRSGTTGATDMHVYVTKLANDTFGTPVETSDGSTTASLDKPWIAVDHDDNVLVTWAKLGDSANPGATGLQFARSADGGATFVPSTIVTGGGRNLMFPCTDRSASGAPYYVTYNAGGNVGLRKSTDGGQTWTTPAGNTAPGMGAVFQDPTCAVSGNDIWLSIPVGTANFTSAMSPPATSFQVIHSTDGGMTFGNPVTVTNGGSGMEYLNSYLVRSPGGKLELLYYQGTEGQPLGYMRAESTDGGATWTQQMMTMPGTMTFNRMPGAWLGDYEGVYSNGGYVYTVFGDNTMSNTTHIRFMKFAAP